MPSAVRRVLLLLLAGGTASLHVGSAWQKEAEKKHGRVAMLAVPALLALGAGGVEEPVRWLSQQSVDTQAVFFSASAVLEAATGLPRLGYGFALKPGVAPGIYPPLGPPTERADRIETALGRAAMLTAAAMLAAGVLA